MNGSKWFVKSKRIQGSIVMLVMLVAMVRGVEIDQAEIETQITAALALAGWAWNLYGSLVAKEKITTRKNGG